jgi:1,4-alpha-glucan branching enzyme
MTPGSASRFGYSLPFGAEVTADGQARFRLWAPDRDEVAVRLESSGTELVMRREPDGWFSLTTGAAPGTAYRYRVTGDLLVPDPASRAQADDVHGPSLVVDPRAYRWQTHDWAGRPWEEAVVCELHVGTATPEGTFNALRRRLDHFVDTGITAIEIMPVADFSGARGWGYDGVLLYAPERSYGTTDDLKRLIDEAHGRGITMLLDVVYNHFGPDGNYLHAYASRFFDETRHTPWGAGINVGRREVRDFFIHNVSYWLQEYRFDGLRFDAVDQIEDGSDEHLLVEIARRVRKDIPDRHVHLVLENDNNAASLLMRDDFSSALAPAPHSRPLPPRGRGATEPISAPSPLGGEGRGGGGRLAGDSARLHPAPAREAAGRPRLYTAQWNDDYHHVAHVLLTGESDGYYEDYATDTAAKLARALAEGYVYQGEKSTFRDGRRRGEPSGFLPSSAFVNFVQNHDQIGNRALGERLTSLVAPEAVEAALALLLLSPQVPLLFMGEQWGETRPFLYFCDFHDELADAVREGRRNEFRRFERFRSPEARATIPDPNAASTFEASKLDWSKLEQPGHAGRLALVKDLLALRAREIAPRLPALRGSAEAAGTLVAARWTLSDGSRLAVVANLGPEHQERAGLVSESPLWAQPAECHLEPAVPPWSVAWTLAPGGS